MEKPAADGSTKELFDSMDAIPTDAAVVIKEVKVTIVLQSKKRHLGFDVRQVLLSRPDLGISSAYKPTLNSHTLIFILLVLHS